MHLNVTGGYIRTSFSWLWPFLRPAYLSIYVNKSSRSYACNVLHWTITGLGQLLSWSFTHWPREKKIAAISQMKFLNAFSWIKMYEFRLKCVPKLRIHNVPAFVQIMAWRRSGDKPLSEAMLVSEATHICATRLQRVNWMFTTYTSQTPISLDTYYLKWV